MSSASAPGGSVADAGATPRTPAHPETVHADLVLPAFTFASGECLRDLTLHYRTIGTLARDAHGVATNAVLILHGTGGSGAQFFRPEFSDRLFAAGGLLDASKYYLVLPDGIGHGGSSKPSDGLRARFPAYGYRDMIDAQHRLLTEGLGIDHLRLVMGTSMGGMHSWLWGQLHPDFMDALMPLASLPGQISGRNRAWRRVVIDVIRNDPAWQGGDYVEQPPLSSRVATQMIWLMSSNAVLRHAQTPTLAQTDALLDEPATLAEAPIDVNDLLYQIEASRDYDPAPGLERIRAPLVAINFADDLINPPELGILEREIVRVRDGKAVVIAASAATSGHGTHTVASVWEHELAGLLERSARR